MSKIAPIDMPDVVNTTLSIIESRLSLMSEERREPFRTHISSSIKKMIIEFMFEFDAERDHVIALFTGHHVRWCKDGRDDQVAYYQNDAKRERDRRNITKLSKLLNRFITDCPPHVLRDFCARVYAERQREFTDRYDIIIAKDADQIVDIYENANFGSCMSFYDSDYLSRVSEISHPVKVYDSPDIGVIGLFDRQQEVFVARAVTNAVTKEYNVVYPNDCSGMRGQCQQKLVEWLKQNGYRHNYNYLHGARVKRIKHHDGWLMPYIDGGDPQFVNPGSTLKDEPYGYIYSPDDCWDQPIDEVYDAAHETYAAQSTSGMVNYSDRTDD